ncbi:hypothetical protein KKG82_06275 [Patescibacteria group bacterium]|nr:hypothetical protein [Patescibacteria group bacterium]
MPVKRFKNQTPEQILKHLKNLLNADHYSLHVDPLGIYMEIKESQSRVKGSRKMAKLKDEAKDLSKGQRRKAGTRKRTAPKIRTVKKGRTVPLKGVDTRKKF